MGFLLCFPYHLTRVLILAQPNKFRVPQVIRTRPLQKLDLRYGFRPEPDALQHLLLPSTPVPIFPALSPAGSRMGTSLMSGV